MSKVAGKARTVKKVVNQKIDHSSKLRVTIGAGMASAGPPLGSQLGQRNINVSAFCKEFNERTANIKDGIPIPCRVKVNSDRQFDLVMHKPPATYYLKQAAGIERGQMKKGDLAGKITLKHLYEIALIKSEDPPMVLLTLEQICQMLVGIARSCGIKVVREIDPVEHEEFMKNREQMVQDYLAELKEARETKMLRTA